MNQELYNSINKLNSPSLIAEKLKEYPAEIREAYRKYGNALRNKAYRDKNKDAINKTRNERRNNKNPIVKNQTEITTDFINNVDTNVKREYTIKTNNKELKQSTIDTYKNTIKRIYKIYNNKDLPDTADIIKYLDGKKYSIKKIKNDFNFIVENIKHIAENHFKYINIIYSVFAGLNYGMTNIKNALYPFVVLSIYSAYSIFSIK